MGVPNTGTTPTGASADIGLGLPNSGTQSLLSSSYLPSFPGGGGVGGSGGGVGQGGVFANTNEALGVEEVVQEGAYG